MKRIIVVSLIMNILLAAGCSQSNEETAAPNKLGVAVSIPPQKAFVQAVGGKLVTVVTMIPPGNSPGNYAPSPKEFTKFSEAKIYFSLGVPADQANILPKAKKINSKLQIVKVNKKVAEVYPERKFSTGSRDPHIWLSPKRVKVMVNIIAQQLSELDPEHKQQYKQNAEKYITKLEQINREIKQVLSQVESKTFIVYHPAFGYFADEYGLEMIAVERGGKEATPKRLQAVIDQARQKNIKVIFHQAEIDSHQSEALAQELGGKTVMIDPLAVDYLANLRKMAETFKTVLE